MLLHKAVSHSIAGISCILNLRKQVNNGVKDAFFSIRMKRKLLRVPIVKNLVMKPLRRAQLFWPDAYTSIQ